jgi:hypothetical protein
LGKIEFREYKVLRGLREKIEANQSVFGLLDRIAAQFSGERYAANDCVL